MNFCYTTCTLEEMAEHFLTLSTQAISQQLIYYKSRNIEIYLKIQKARVLCKQLKLQHKLELLNV